MIRFAVMGVDMSLRAAGFVAVQRNFATPYPDVMTTEDIRARRVMVETFGEDLAKAATMFDQLHRLQQLRDHAEKFYLSAGSPAHVVFEEYAFSASTSRAHAIGEAAGVVKLRLFDLGASVVSVTASSARKFLYGIGNLPSKEAKATVRATFEAAGYVGYTEAEYDALCVANWKLSDLGLPCFASPPVERKKKGKRT